MGKLLNFPGHQWARCTDPGCRCGACEGGLSLCLRCGGAEASLPTDCPGEEMSGTEVDLVQAGLWDFDRRRGWVQGKADTSGRPRGHQYR